MKKSKTTKATLLKGMIKKKGFTIIEVVLVLAIAGLIFLMVFIALPNLQRTQRDTQRRNDVARVATAIDQYFTNGNQNFITGSGSVYVGTNGNVNARGTTATSRALKDFYINYLRTDEDAFEDPHGKGYGLYATSCARGTAVWSEGGRGRRCAYFSIATGNSNDPSWYAFPSIPANITFESQNYHIVIVSSAACGTEEGVIIPADGSKKYAVMYKLEGNGFYCIDNS